MSDPVSLLVDLCLVTTGEGIISNPFLQPKTRAFLELAPKINFLFGYNSKKNRIKDMKHFHLEAFFVHKNTFYVPIMCKTSHILPEYS